MATHTENIVISITDKGATVVKKDIADIGNAAKGASKETSFLGTALTALISVGTIAALAHYSDQFVQIQNKIKIVTSSTAELNDTTNKLADIAANTFTSFDALTDVYTKVSLSSKDLGLTQKQTLDFTQSLAQATALSGVSAQTAASGLYQLTQGLGKGALQGQDLKAVLEDLPYLSTALQAGLGKNKEELMAMAEAGQLAPKAIIDAFAKIQPEIAADFAKLNPTINQALGVLDTRLTQAAGQISGVFSVAAEAIIFFANHLDAIVIAATPVIAILTALAVKTIGTILVTSLAEGVQALAGFALIITTEVIPAVASFAVAVAVNPLTLWAAAIAIVVGSVTALVYWLVTGRNAWNDLVDAVTSKTGDLTKAFDSIVAIFSGTASSGSGGGLNDFLSKNKLGGGGAGGKGQSSSNPNLSADDVAENIKAATTTGAVALKTNIDGGFATGLDLLNSQQSQSFKSGADTVSTSMDKSFSTGADTVGKSITSAFASAAGAGSSSVSGGGPNINGSWEEYMASVQAWSDNWVATQGYNGRNSGNKGLSGIGDDYIKTVVDNKSSSHFAAGGSFRVGGQGGTDSQLVQFRASPDEQVTITTPDQRKRAANGNSPQGGATVINTLDASNIPMAMNTAKGRETIMNMMKFNQEDFREALGI